MDLQVDMVEQFLGGGRWVALESLEKNRSLFTYDWVPLSEDAWGEKVMECPPIISPELAVPHNAKTPFKIHTVNRGSDGLVGL